MEVLLWLHEGLEGLEVVVCNRSIRGWDPLWLDLQEHAESLQD
jgi:hypothetical protein